jgi:hypothetical protein
MEGHEFILSHGRYDDHWGDDNTYKDNEHENCSKIARPSFEYAHERVEEGFEDSQKDE